jgi:hypothetical protein
MAAKSKSAQDKSAQDKSPRIAIGLRVKTGRATAVVMTGPASAPRVLSRKSLQLWDPAVPESHQPWHAEFELPAEESALIVPKALEAVERVALSALRELVGEVQTGQGAILGISLVAGSATDPESIHNPHMRAHARAGQLFPDALAAAARAMRIPSATMVESEVFATAAAKLGKSPDAIKIAVTEMGRAVGKPWSAEEKCAAAAAWITLAG